MGNILMRRREMILPSGGGGGLPSEYQEVNYIQTSRTQFIQTGIIPTKSSRFVLEWELVNAIDGKNSTIMGCNVRGDNSKNWQIRAHGLIVAGSIGGDWSNVGTIPNGTIDMRYGIVILNGVIETYKAGDLTSTGVGLPLGCLLTNGTINKNAEIAIKIKGFVAYSNADDESSIIQHLVPCYRKSDLTVGMYDVINRVFLTNGGTGDFVYG